MPTIDEMFNARIIQCQYMYVYVYGTTAIIYASNYMNNKRQMKLLDLKSIDWLGIVTATRQFRMFADRI